MLLKALLNQMSLSDKVAVQNAVKKIKRLSSSFKRIAKNIGQLEGESEI